MCHLITFWILIILAVECLFKVYNTYGGFWVLNLYIAILSLSLSLSLSPLIFCTGIHGLYMKLICNAKNEKASHELDIFIFFDFSHSLWVLCDGYKINTLWEEWCIYGMHSILIIKGREIVVVVFGFVGRNANKVTRGLLATPRMSIRVTRILL